MGHHLGTPGTIRSHK